MKNLLIDYICKLFDLQRKPVQEYKFITNYSGSDVIFRGNGGRINALTPGLVSKAYIKGIRVYEITCTIKLLG